MDIMAYGDGKFSIAMFSELKYAWNLKDKTLSVWGDKDSRAVHVQTPRGVFIEALSEDGEVLCEGGDSDWFYVAVTKTPIKLRYKELPDPNLSKAALEKVRLTVTRYLLSDAPYSLNIPDTLSGTIAWMEKQLKKIPAASRAKASFRFDTTMSYGETYPNIEITYSERETDAEVIERVKVERERVRIKESAERSQLANLQKKFGT